MEAKKSVLRSRKPLSDCTNKVAAASSPSRLTSSTFSSSFIKSRKSSVSSDVKLLPGDGVNAVAGCSDGTPRTDCSEAPYVPCSNELPLASSSTPVLNEIVVRWEGVQMEAKKSALRSRKPLSDCTNKVIAASSPSRLTPSTFSSSFIKSRKSSVSSDVKLLPGDGVNAIAGCSDGTPRTDCSEAPYVPCSNELPLASSSTPVLLEQPSDNGCSGGTPRTDCSKAPNQLSLASSSTPVLLEQPSDNGVDDSSLEPQSFYTRRRRMSKRKHEEAKIDLSFFSHTAPKVQDNKSTLNKHGYDDRPQACTVPHKKKRNANKNALPQDFIERQRAYFAEIDAFELPEEEVESVLELD